MRIAVVEPMIVEVPMRAPVKAVHGVVRAQRSVLVRVATDEGREGWGNVDPSAGYTLMSAEQIRDTVAALAPVLVGRSPRWTAPWPSDGRPRPPWRWRSAT